MSDVDSFEAFAKAYADPTSPGYKNQRKAYKLVHPECNDESAKKGGQRMMKDERVRAYIATYQDAVRVVTGKSHEEYLAFGWKLMETMAEKVIDNPKLGTALAKVFETVGKAGGWLINKSEDLTPLERKLPIDPNAAADVLEERARNYRRMNEPLPLPQGTAKLVPSAVPAAEAVDVEYDTLPTTPGNDAEAAISPLHEG